jgi:hypothetical protein
MMLSTVRHGARATPSLAREQHAKRTAWHGCRQERGARLMRRCSLRPVPDHSVPAWQGREIILSPWKRAASGWWLTGAAMTQWRFGIGDVRPVARRAALLLRDPSKSARGSGEAVRIPAHRAAVAK